MKRRTNIPESVKYLGSDGSIKEIDSSLVEPASAYTNGGIAIIDGIDQGVILDLDLLATNSSTSPTLDAAEHVVNLLRTRPELFFGSE